MTMADALRFAKVCQMAAAMHEHDNKCDVPNCQHPAALRALAALCERAERVPVYMNVMNPSETASIARALAAGFTPEASDDRPA